MNNAELEAKAEHAAELYHIRLWYEAERADEERQQDAEDFEPYE